MKAYGGVDITKLEIRINVTIYQLCIGRGHVECYLTNNKTE